MATPQDARKEIMIALRDHFDRTGAALTPEEIVEMTALPLDAVANGLRVLYEANKIKGIMVAEQDYPVKVTGLVYQ